MHIIRFPGLAPPGGREELPAGVYLWLMPVQMAIDRAREEAQRNAARR